MQPLETKNSSEKTSAVAIIGLLAGLAGGVIGSVYVAPWYQKNILKEEPGAVARQTVVDEESAIIAAVEKVNPAVVSIIISKDLPKLEQYASPFGDIFFSVPSGELEKQKIGAGSGFIISADGMIVTNKHVVADPQAEYTVITKDGQKYDADILATDPANDLAIVKIAANDLPFVNLGDSDQLKLGQRVIAIGNALGEFQNTVTTGVISGIKRDVTASGGTQTERLTEVIQTDAAINPGNSGGPLLNLSGEVIGVNTAVSSEAQLIGFAIPVGQLKKVIDDVKQFGKVRRPFLGVRYVIITESYARQNNLPVNYGVLIVSGDALNEPAVIPGSPAAKAGIARGDIILELDGQKITPENQLAEQLRGRNPGDQVTLKLLRNGEERTVSVTLGEAE
ncbi:MAG: trypsin-like peptidase domain-containing protein [Candidatus Doudnabacteria bacterium]|nr:trypsin-like peptidase domain-containing protein [Candidatus Doudnabacteria bacterium]